MCLPVFNFFLVLFCGLEEYVQSVVWSVCAFISQKSVFDVETEK